MIKQVEYLFIKFFFRFNLIFQQHPLFLDFKKNYFLSKTKAIDLKYESAIKDFL